jgi:RNA polymerase sigma-70 factor, ECF subfamily
MDEVRPDSADTQELLERVEAGDRAALGELLDRHRDLVRRFVELRLDPRMLPRLDPSDVVQEAQLEVARRIGEYLARRPMPFRLWLHRTALENLLRLRRQHVEAECRSVSREVSLSDSSSVLLARHLMRAHGAPARQMVEEELKERVREAVAELDETDREVLLLRTFEGLDNQETACVLGLEPGTASKRYGRALLHLRKVMLDRGITDSQP